jgi:hypothetical protein
MNRCEIRGATILQLDVTVNRLTSPHTAQAQFVGIIRYRDRKGESPYGTHRSPFTVHFQKEGDRWIVTGYEANVPGY